MEPHQNLELEDFSDKVEEQAEELVEACLEVNLDWHLQNRKSMWALASHHHHHSSVDKDNNQNLAYLATLVLHHHNLGTYFLLQVQL